MKAIRSECPQCGAASPVSAGSFRCAYCGTRLELPVQDSYRTSSPEGDGIGATRTAAELALVRLGEERQKGAAQLEALTHEAGNLRSQLKEELLLPESRIKLIERRVLSLAKTTQENATKGVVIATLAGIVCWGAILAVLTLVLPFGVHNFIDEMVFGLMALFVPPVVAFFIGLWVHHRSVGADQGALEDLRRELAQHHAMAEKKGLLAENCKQAFAAQAKLDQIERSIARNQEIVSP
jgi:hypothetical protein